MTKVKITVTSMYEYEIYPENYGDCQTDEERMAMDLENFNLDPTFLDMMDATEIKIVGEIIDNDERENT